MDMKGKVISGFIASKNIYYDKQNFEIDFVLSVPKVDFTMVEVKYPSGQCLL